MIFFGGLLECCRKLGSIWVISPLYTSRLKIPEQEIAVNFHQVETPKASLLVAKRNSTFLGFPKVGYNQPIHPTLGEA